MVCFNTAGVLRKATTIGLKTALLAIVLSACSTTAKEQKTASLAMEYRNQANYDNWWKYQKKVPYLTRKAGEGNPDRENPIGYRDRFTGWTSVSNDLYRRQKNMHLNY